jgi:uncharacterized protein YdaU (DUF1376 family)
MAKDPSVLWYTSDFLTGTGHFTHEELGFYTRLLAYQHQQGHLSIEFIQRLAGRKFEKLWSVVKSKFSQGTDSKFFNERMDKEIEKRKAYSTKQKENAAMRWHKVGNAVGMPLENANENENNLGKSENPLPKPSELSELSGLITYDAEKEIIANQIDFERISMKARKPKDIALYSLRKYHLHLLSNERYPMGRVAVFAGFEKWLMEEKAKEVPAQIAIGEKKQSKQEQITEKIMNQVYGPNKS